MRDERSNPNRVRIHYCTRCGWLLRSAWIAQELLSTFADELDEVSLAPAEPGVFRIEAGERLLWDRARDGGFPDINELKRRVRDQLQPGRDLGHVEQSGHDRRQN